MKPQVVALTLSGTRVYDEYDKAISELPDGGLFRSTLYVPLHNQEEIDKALFYLKRLKSKYPK